VWISRGKLGKELVIYEGRCFTSHVFNKMKVASWMYERSRWEKRKYTGNNKCQLDIEMLKKVVKVYTHRLRGLDIQLIPSALGGVSDCIV
jgi:hypothetical protein